MNRAREYSIDVNTMAKKNKRKQIYIIPTKFKTISSVDLAAGIICTLKSFVQDTFPLVCCKMNTEGTTKLHFQINQLEIVIYIIVWQSAILCNLLIKVKHFAPVQTNMSPNASVLSLLLANDLASASNCETKVIKFHSKEHRGIYKRPLQKKQQQTQSFSDKMLQEVAKLSKDTEWISITKDTHSRSCLLFDAVFIRSVALSSPLFYTLGMSISL